MKNYYAANPPPRIMHKFDTRAHYPFREAVELSVPDIVYRTVPVITDTSRQLYQSIVSEAGTPPSAKFMDVGAGVPRNPVVRELFVDAATGSNICKILIYLT